MFDLMTECLFSSRDVKLDDRMFGWMTGCLELDD